MASSRRSRRNVDYKKFCTEGNTGSDSDDDFQPSPVEPSEKKARTRKPTTKDKTTKSKKAKEICGVSKKPSPNVEIAENEERLSREEKLFQRDLDAALRLSSTSDNTSQGLATCAEPTSCKEDRPQVLSPQKKEQPSRPLGTPTLQSSLRIPGSASLKCLSNGSTTLGNVRKRASLSTQAYSSSVTAPPVEKTKPQSSLTRIATPKPLGGVKILSPSTPTLRIGLSRNIRLAKPLHSNVKST